MPSPISGSQQVVTYPSPNTTDTLFFETVSIAQGDPVGASTDYGTVHPNTTRFPNHKLCFIENIEDKQNQQRWWYVNDRTSQEAYNYEISYPYGGDTQFPRLTRTYVVPRGTQPIPLGTADASSPFTSTDTYIRSGSTTDEYLRPDGTSRYIRPALPSAVLVFQSEKPLDGQIGSLYVQQTRVYDVIPGSATSDASGITQADNGYSVDRPLATSSFLRVTWKITLPRTVADSGIQTNYTGCPIPGFSSLLLTDEKIDASDENNQIATVTRIYEGNATGIPFPSTEAIVGQKKEYPGALPPGKFISSTIDVSRTVEIDSPENATVLDSAPSGTILSAVVVKPKDVLRGQKEVTYSTPTRATLSGRQWDPQLNAYTSYTSYTASPADAAALTAVAGQELTITPYSPSWSVVTSESPPQSSIIGGTAVKYYTTYPFSWPAVLIEDSFHWGAIPTKRNGVLTGSSELYFEYELKPAWTGLCKAEVSVAFHATNPLITAAFIPTENISINPIIIEWPGLASFRLPPCIHGEYTFSGTTGTTNPDYGFVAYSKTYRASTVQTTSGSTDITDWPDSLIVDYDVKPYKGGFLVRQVKVFKPY